MTTLVVGTGYTGARLLRRLPIDDALGLSRSRPADTGGRRVDILSLDEPLEQLTPDGVYDLVYTVPPAVDSDTDRRLEALLLALATPPRRFVYLSTTGVYGDRAGAEVDESAELRPQTQRARRRVAAETALRAYGQSRDSAIVILRVPGIYGPHRLMIDRVRDGSPLIRDSEANPGNRIHVDDLVTACLAALSPDVPPGIYNLGDGDRRTSTWFSTQVAALLGLEPPPGISRSEAEASFSARRLSFLGESRRIDTARMREVLGVRPRYSNAEDGIRASLVEMGLLDREGDGGHPPQE